MAQRAFVVGGTGQTGRAVVRRLVRDGWSVTVASRGQYPHAFDKSGGVRVIRLDRTEPDQLAVALPTGTDVLIDLIAHNADDARQLLQVADRVGSLIVLSTLGVYADAEGRNIRSAYDGRTDFPEFPVPITEDQPTVSADDTGYPFAAGKVALEQTLLDQSPVPVTVIRPGAIHGPESTYAREWWLVKRVLDDRKSIVLAHSDNVFHPTATANLADLIVMAAHRPGTRILNCGDPEPPTALEITQTLLDLMECSLPILILPGEPPYPGVGDHPWLQTGSLVADLTAAERELGFRPVTAYAAAAARTVSWLCEEVAGDDWWQRLPRVAALRHFFDYQAEDAFLRRLAYA
ncbi:MAG: NAD-dependent epimerase/dehydratase family protein [Actinoallomurus sp.]